MRYFGNPAVSVRPMGFPSHPRGWFSIIVYLCSCDWHYPPTSFQLMCFNSHKVTFIGFFLSFSVIEMGQQQSSQYVLKLTCQLY